MKNKIYRINKKNNNYVIEIKGKFWGWNTKYQFSSITELILFIEENLIYFDNIEWNISKPKFNFSKNLFFEFYTKDNSNVSWFLMLTNNLKYFKQNIINHCDYILLYEEETNSFNVKKKDFQIEKYKDYFLYYSIDNLFNIKNTLEKLKIKYDNQNYTKEEFFNTLEEYNQFKNQNPTCNILEFKEIFSFGLHYYKIIYECKYKDINDSIFCTDKKYIQLNATLEILNSIIKLTNSILKCQNKN